MKQLTSSSLQDIENPGLAQGIDRLWTYCRSRLASILDLSTTPQQLGQLILQYIDGSIKATELQIIKAVKLSHIDDKKEVDYLEKLLKLFDGSHNSYVSITNVLSVYQQMQRDLEQGKYDLRLFDYITVNGRPLKQPKLAPNKSLCPICRRFPQEQNALGLITGGPKVDSIFQTYRNGVQKRASMKICRYCFTVGWIDLPTANFEKDGDNIVKDRRYVFITTPLSQSDIQLLLDLISYQDVDQVESLDATDTLIEKGNHIEEETELSISSLSKFIEEKFGESLNTMPVLGLSQKRLKELQGFVLPSTNPLQRVVALQVPISRLVGEEKVSGIVRRELIKATMYDFWKVTSSFSMHYNRIMNVPFSIDGQPVELEDMRRANVAYNIANRYARVGKYRQLNSGLFMLLLTNPREATNRILRAKHRDKQYAPGKDKIKEVIELTETIAKPDWKFELGLHIVSTLVEVGLLKKAQSFRSGPKPTDVYTGVDLVKWLQRLKMIKDESSARAWGNMLINALKRGDVAYKEYIHSQGGEVIAPGKDRIAKILNLVDGDEGIIQTCQRQEAKFSEVVRDIANMDYYLLFYYNQRQAVKNNQQEEIE